MVELSRMDLKVPGSNPGGTWIQKNSTVEDFNFAFSEPLGCYFEEWKVFFLVNYFLFKSILAGCD